MSRLSRKPRSDRSPDCASQVADLSAALLSFLRRRLGRYVDYLEPPSRFVSGDSTIVAGFHLRNAPPPLDGPLVLRGLLGPAETGERLRIEVAAQEAVRSQGYPAPAVFLDDSGEDMLGWPFLIMERIPGRVALHALLETLGRGRWMGLVHWGPFIARRLPRLLGRSLAQLHALEVAPLEEALRRHGMEPREIGLAARLHRIRARVREVGSPELEQAASWLAQHRPPPAVRASICHGDPNPMNLILEGGELSGVLDWSHVALTRAELDLGVLRTLPVSHLPLGIVPSPAIYWLQRAFARAAEREYRMHRSFDEKAVDYFEAVHLVFIALSVMERRNGSTAERGGAHGGDNPVTRARVEERIRRLTGSSLSWEPAR